MEKLFPRKDEIEWFCHPSPSAKLIYWQNPKVACSSIKKSLWKLEKGQEPENVHIRRESPFPYLSDLGVNAPEYDFFTIVRNPYSRVLSAYLDKIGKGADRHIWWPFCRDFGIPRSTTKEQFNFLSFLKALKSTSPHNLDPHFRPQFHNLLPTIVPYSFIGFLEEQGSVQSFLESKSIPYVHSAPHARNAGNKLLEYYGDEEIALVQSIYSSDFDFFGYSLDIENYSNPGKAIGSLDRQSNTTFVQQYSNFTKLLRNTNISPLAEIYHQITTLENQNEKINTIKKAINENLLEENWSFLKSATSILSSTSNFVILKELLNKSVGVKFDYK
ncbi:sulfotransferase family 2 domain-containing protein [Microbulbifer sp. ALW1]|uniref:sulfotransferase family 2 domain-containing protein n=1 Tax=Microbulbifer sp. (strain ALW1) TaxID=1516059 RepID=UPI00135BC525|nr:sulfotransferase family 2 domain-containing protein [Microbulbifer sp. ALW1]